MQHLQGLIFDLDGTLLDSAPDLRQAVNKMLGQHGRRPLTLGETKQAVGDGAMALVRKAFAFTGDVPSNDLFPFVQEYIQHYRQIKADPAQIYPHVLDMITQYSQDGVKLGICTNKPEAATYKLLEELNIRHHFEFIAGSDTFPTHKPNPEHIYGVITALDVPPENCVMVGDSINDVLAAHGAGIPCIVVTQGYGRDFEELRADFLIKDFSELPAAISKLGFT